MGENMKRRLLQILTTVFVVSSLFVTPVFAVPEDDSGTSGQNNSEIDALEKKKHKAEEEAASEMEALEQQKSEAEAEAASINSELVDLLVEYDALQLDIENQGKKIDQAEDDYKDARKKEKQQYKDMKLRIKYMYEEGSVSLFLTLFSSESFADFLSKAEYVQKVHEYDRNMLDEYVETKKEVKELKEGLEADEAEMQALSEEMVVQKTNLESTLDVMRSQISDFDNQLTQAKAAAAEEIRRIEAEQKAAEKAAEAAAMQEKEQQAASTSQNVSEVEEQKEINQEDEKKEEPKKEEPKKEDSKKEDPKKEESEEQPKKEDAKQEEVKKEESVEEPKQEEPKQEEPEQEEPKKEDPKKEEPKQEEIKKEESVEEPKQEEPKKKDPVKEDLDDVPVSNSGDTSLGQQIADMGCQYIGNKYVYGGLSLTNGIDCSGFVNQIHKKFGIYTPRTSSDIRKGGKPVNYADKLPGDVICYSGHVGIYIGNNQIVHASNSAPYPAGGIKITSPANYRTVLAVRRYW